MDQPTGGPRRPAWLAGQRKTVYLGAAVLTIAVFFATVYLWADWRYYREQTPGHPALFGDFLPLWSYAEMLRQFAAADLYDSVTLHRHQVDWGLDPSRQAPFPYPPFFMPIVRLLNVLPYNLSYLVWIGGTLVLLLWVVRATCALPVWSLAAIAVAPASILCIAAGQTGFLAAGLMVLCLGLAQTEPAVAGIALGLLAYKPQLAVLLPVTLWATGAWRAILWGGVAAAGMGLLASSLYGWAVWPAWLAMLPRYDAAFQLQTQLWNQQPSLTAMWRSLGWPPGLGIAGQSAAFLAVCAMIWRFARGLPEDMVAALTLIGTFVATPHALAYDMPVTAVALALFVRHRLRTAGGLTTLEVVTVSAVALLPVYMMSNAAWLPVGWPCLVLLFAIIAGSPSGGVTAQPVHRLTR